MKIYMSKIPGAITSPAGCVTTSRRSSKCLIVILNPHRDSVIPIVCVMYKSLFTLENKSCSLSCKTTIRLPVSAFGFYKKKKKDFK